MDDPSTPNELAAHPCALLRLAPEAGLRLLDAIPHDPEGAATLQTLIAALRQHGSFDLLPIVVQERLQPDPCFQAEALRDGAMHTVTAWRLAAEPARILAAVLERPWSWWRHGKVVGWRRRPDGGARFVLFPMWLRSPARVGVELAAPAVVEERTACGTVGTKTLLSARFFGDFRGPGRYEIVHAGGGAVLRSAFDGVERAGFTRIMPASMVLDLHVRAESGRLRFPFPAGTGFGGLRDALA